MKAIDINITPLQKFFNLFRVNKMPGGKVKKDFKETKQECTIFPDSESITQFQRKAYMGNFMAGPFTMIAPGFFKTEK